MTDGGWLLWLLGMMIVVVVQLLVWFDLRALLQEVQAALRISPSGSLEVPPVSFEVSEYEAALLEQEQMRASAQRAGALASRLPSSARALRRTRSTESSG
jgi:hypothetical protein